MSDETVEDRIAARREAEQEHREALARMGLDGPHTFSGGDMFGGMFAEPLVYAICVGTGGWVGCGSMVRLSDPEEFDGKPDIERSVRLHLEWHAALDGG